MNKGIFIREEVFKDRPFIYSVHRRAFHREDEAILVDKLRNSAAYIPELSLVAYNESNTLTGHVLFTRLELEGHNGLELLALAPMAVLPKFQRTGVGSELVREGLIRAGELGYSGVIVLGHAKYYPRFGFVPASKFVIKSPFKVPDDVFMALELKKGILTNKRGVVKYPREFSE
ncbi:N-acetyltransferase [Zunongwangia sp. F363]|uniref:N-acetyltransferase n=1 Tax=Autumnicola tepida TaxID=3075595 RepID=A0ABU3CET9_9FLAO|nr:N-acetyltransferase [Zunongwangia sp. F363]MDT0644821.1 N-acetyltransferase [Zunongwangia sp. F363]